MLTQDPLQNYQTLSAYSGGATQFGVPTAFQPSINPMNPLAFNPLVAATQQFANPLTGGFAGQQIPLQQTQNPLWAHSLQHSLAHSQNPALSALQQNALQAAIQQNALQAAIQQQNALQAAIQQNPLLLASLQNPFLQQQVTQGHLQNPLATAGLQNPQFNPAQFNPAQFNPAQFNPAQFNPAQFNPVQFNPMQSWYGWQQQQPQFSYPLAPQSLIGAGGLGQNLSPLYPTAQGAFRPASGYGTSPFAGCF